MTKRKRKGSVVTGYNQEQARTISSLDAILYCTVCVTVCTHDTTQHNTTQLNSTHQKLILLTLTVRYGSMEVPVLERSEIVCLMMGVCV